MAHAGASVDIVVAEARAHQLLYDVGLLVGAARRGDAADRVAAILRLNALEFRGRVADRFFPRDFAPGIGDLRADHGLEDTIRMGSVPNRKASLDAGVPVGGMAVHVRHHAYPFLALHLAAGPATHSAVGARRGDPVLG